MEEFKQNTISKVESSGPVTAEIQKLISDELTKASEDLGEQQLLLGNDVANVRREVGMIEQEFIELKSSFHNQPEPFNVCHNSSNHLSL